MGLSIEQKIEDYQKKIVIKQNISLGGIIITLTVLVLFLLPFLKSYSINPHEFSSLNTQDLLIFLVVIIFVLIIWLLQYLSNIHIIKDMSNGSIIVQKRSLKNESIVFRKEENPSLKLSKLPFILFLFTKQKFILSIVSNSKRIILNPDITIRWLTIRGSYYRNRNDPRWTFAKEDAENISNFLGIPLSNEIGGANEATEYYK